MQRSQFSLVLRNESRSIRLMLRNAIVPKFDSNVRLGNTWTSLCQRVTPPSLTVVDRPLLLRSFSVNRQHHCVFAKSSGVIIW